MYHQETVETGAIPDQEIVKRISQGEKNLYALIIRRYNQRLYRVGMSILHDEAEVEDAMQESYVNAWGSLEKFQFKSQFSTWLTRIMINECLLQIKKRKKNLEMKEEMMDHYHQTTDQQNALSKILNADLKKALEQAVLDLPEKYRTVFIMREVEHMNVFETKECLAISESNVKVRLNRAKALLRNSLNDLYKSGDVFGFHLSRCDKMVDRVMARIS